MCDIKRCYMLYSIYIILYISHYLITSKLNPEILLLFFSCIEEFSVLSLVVLLNFNTSNSNNTVNGVKLDKMSASCSCPHPVIWSGLCEGWWTIFIPPPGRTSYISINLSAYTCSSISSHQQTMPSETIEQNGFIFGQQLKWRVVIWAHYSDLSYLYFVCQYFNILKLVVTHLSPVLKNYLKFVVIWFEL